MKNRRLLKAWNPLDQGRWLWWLFIKPEYLDTYAHDHTGDSEALNIGAWVASALFWLPFALTWIVVALRAGAYGGMFLALIFLALGFFLMAVLGTPSGDQFKAANQDHGQSFPQAYLNQLLIIILVVFYYTVLIAGITAHLADLDSLWKERLVLALGAATGAAGGVAYHADHRPDLVDRVIYIFAIILIAMGIMLGAGFEAASDKGLTIVAANTLFPALFIFGFASALRSPVRGRGLVKHAAALIALGLAEIAPVLIVVWG